MNRRPFEMIAGLGLFLLLALPARASERRYLETQIPAPAARIPLLKRLPSTNRLQLAIGLPLRNQDSLTNLFTQMYDRSSTNFHHFLTPGQFAEKFGPAEQDYQSVLSFARSNRLEVMRTYGNRALVDVEGSVADIEKAFQVHMGIYQHPTENRQFFGPDMMPSVDTNLPVLFLSGMDNFVIPRPHGHAVRPESSRISTPDGGPTSSGGGSYGGSFIGNDFRHAYVPGTTLTGAGQVVGLFERQGYTPSDVQAYESAAGISPGVPVVNVLATIAAGTNQQNWECVSDIELAIAMAPGLKQVSVYEGNNNASIITAIATTNTASFPLPSQVSCSWGIDGDSTIVQGLMQLAMQGQSFLYAVGDSGAYANGTDNSSSQGVIFMTDVGGTQLFMTNSGASWQSEVVWRDTPPTNFVYFSTTGGTWPNVPIPNYQKGVNMTLNNGSTQYRNVPDVALVARDIEIVWTTANATNGAPQSGFFGGWVGTSGAAPLFAGIIALANQQAASQGKPPVGFLNPAIYEIAEGQSYGTCFHDITTGSNVWNDTYNGTSSANLYTASTGYDLCTGWGTPSSQSFIDDLTGLAGPCYVNFNYTGATQNGQYSTPYKTLAQGVNGVANYGTIFIETAGSSSETMTITKPMTINSQNGAATVGHP